MKRSVELKIAQIIVIILSIMLFDRILTVYRCAGILAYRQIYKGK